MTDTLEPRQFPPRACERGEASPFQADGWLAMWRVIGGGVSIDREGRLHPFRFARTDLDPETTATADRLETDLLDELDRTPGLALAVRAVASAAAAAGVRGALKTMGIDQ